MHRKKPFRKIVAEMATAVDLSTETVSDCDADDEFIDQKKNGLTDMTTDFNCNVTTSQT